MEFPKNFIKATEKYCTLDNKVPAPHLRRNFEVKPQLTAATLVITGLGFYRAFVNGAEITKGYMAPYRSNIDHYIYYDSYDLTNELKSCKNTLGIMLGNGI